MDQITCSMCGERFDPVAHQTCGACPLQGGCQLACCPACGFETVNPERSRLARLAKRWLFPSKDHASTHPSQRS